MAIKWAVENRDFDLLLKTDDDVLFLKRFDDVVCDASNNTAQVIDSNQFRGDIFIKPSRAINFIQLNFVAVRSGVEFSEVAGAI